MKKVILWTAILILLNLFKCPIVTEASMLLVGGQSAIFRFNSLSYISSQTIGDQTNAYVRLSGNLLDSGESIKMDVFAELASPPISSHIFYTPTDDFEVGIVGPPQDIKGAIKLTMITGSVNLSEIEMRIYKDGSLFAQTIECASSISPLIFLLLNE